MGDKPVPFSFFNQRNLRNLRMILHPASNHLHLTSNIG